MDRLLVPLRSNAAWFTDEEAHTSLERRIKSAAVVHDHLVFQDGRYLLNVWEDGVMDWIMPPGAIPGDRSDIRYRQPGGSAQLMIRSSGAEEEEEWLPIFRGETVESLEVDFYPILARAGLLSEDFVELSYYHVSDEGKKRFQGAAQLDRRDPELVSALNVARFQQKPMLEAVHFDTALAAYVKAPFLTDQRIGAFVNAKGKQIISAHWKLDLRPAILDITMGVVLPDFSELDWEHVVQIRTSGAGLDLRRHIALAAREIATEGIHIEDPRDLTILIQNHYLVELSEELQRQYPTVGKTALSFVANLIPGLGSVVTSAADVANLIDHSNSWVALVGKRKGKSA